MLSFVCEKLGVDAGGVTKVLGLDTDRRSLLKGHHTALQYFKGPYLLRITLTAAFLLCVASPACPSLDWPLI